MLTEEEVHEFSRIVGNWIKSKKDITEKDILVITMSKFFSYAEILKVSPDLLKIIFNVMMKVYNRKTNQN